MKIYLDGMFYRATGLGRLYQQLLALLASEPWVTGVVTTVPQGRRREFEAEISFPHVEPHFVPWGPLSLGDVTLKASLLWRIARRVSLSVYPGPNVPIGAPRPDLVSVNDTIPFTDLLGIPAAKKAVFRWLVRRTIHRSRCLVTISDTARADIVSLFPSAIGKIHTVYPWVDPAFFETRRDANAALSRPEEGYLLFLGRRDRHKNLETLVRAFEILASEFPFLRLVIAGPRRFPVDAVDIWRTTSNVSDRVEDVVAPDDATVRTLVARASVFVFPSRAEGFGLPPLEAMAAGVPVVSSDLPVLREIYGDAVQWVNPLQPEHFAGGIRDLLLDEGSRTELVRRGRERASIYTRDRSEGHYRNLLRTLVRQPLATLGGTLNSA